MDHKALIQKAVEILKCQSETEDGSDFILELELEADRNQIVYLWLDEEVELEHADTKAYLFMEADVAGYEEGVDLAALLREANEFVMCRLYIDEEEDDNIAVQAALPLAGLTAQMLAAAIWETATEADRLEDLLEEE